MFARVRVCAWIKMAFVWIASYPHGHRQWRQLVGGDQAAHNASRHCLLPRGDGWMQTLMRVDPDFNVTPDVADVRATNIRMLGLARLRPGSMWKITAEMDWAMRAQWQYYKKPVDAFFPIVEEFFPLTETVEGLMRNRRAMRSRGVDAAMLAAAIPIVLGREGLFVCSDPLLDAQVVTKVGCQMPARALLEHFGEEQQQFATLLLVEPLARLLELHRLPRLLLLSRWHGALQVFREWPDQRWGKATAGKHYERVSKPAGCSDVVSLATDLRRWAPRIVCDDADSDEGPNDELQLLEKHLQTLDAMAAELSGTSASGVQWGVQKPNYAGCVLLNTVLAAREMKSAADFNGAMLLTFFAFLPPTLQSFAREAVSNNTLNLPTWDSRLVMIVDTALMLYRRRHVALAPAARYGFADSSPQAGHDWLIMKIRTIQDTHVVSAFEAMSLLARDAKAAVAEEDAMEDHDEPELAHKRPCRAQLYDKLKRAVAEWTLPPMALGLGHTSLPDKVGLLVFAIFLEVSLEHMRSFLDGFISITTDMGTELGMGDYQDAKLVNLLPDFVLDSAFLPDGVEVDEAMELIRGHCMDYLFRQVLTVAGVLHIFSNASKDLYRSLSCWSHLHKSLKVLEKLVTNKERMNKFIHKCLACFPFDGKDFKKLAPHLYDKRWGEVYKFCSWLEGDRIAILREAWNTSRFLEGPVEDWEDTEDGFSPPAIAEVLADSAALACIDLVVELDKVVSDMLSPTPPPFYV